MKTRRGNLSRRQFPDHESCLEFCDSLGWDWDEINVVYMAKYLESKWEQIYFVRIGTWQVGADPTNKSTSKTGLMSFSFSLVPAFHIPIFKVRVFHSSRSKERGELYLCMKIIDKFIYILIGWLWPRESRVEKWEEREKCERARSSTYDSGVSIVFPAKSHMSKPNSHFSTRRRHVFSESWFQVFFSFFFFSCAVVLCIGDSIDSHKLSSLSSLNKKYMYRKISVRQSDCGECRQRDDRRRSSDDDCVM